MAPKSVALYIHHIVNEFHMRNVIEAYRVIFFCESFKPSTLFSTSNKGTIATNINKAKGLKNHEVASNSPDKTDNSMLFFVILQTL
jgi:hypothetical protein